MRATSPTGVRIVGDQAAGSYPPTRADPADLMTNTVLAAAGSPPAAGPSSTSSRPRQAPAIRRHNQMGLTFTLRPPTFSAAVIRVISPRWLRATKATSADHPLYRVTKSATQRPLKPGHGQSPDGLGRDRHQDPGHVRDLLARRPFDLADDLDDAGPGQTSSPLR